MAPSNATSDLIARFAELAVGMDPREVGKIVVSLRAITRMSIGGVNHEAIAAIENACLDIKAKALGVPVYELFGGPFRDRINLYWSHCGSFRVWRKDFFEGELEAEADPHARRHQATWRRGEGEGIQIAEDQSVSARPDDPPFMPGFRMMPNFLSRHPDAKTDPQYSRHPRQRSATAPGPTWRCAWTSTSASAPKASCASPRRSKTSTSAWLECDIHDPEALALLRRSTSTPIASLETIHGLQAFKPYLANYACDVAIVDVQWNGMWESVRIASLADAFETDCAPHNFAGHLSSYISAHFCAAIPNYRIMEYDVDEVPWRNDIFTHPPVIENGQFVLPTRPGWGTDINEEAVKAHPPRKKPPPARVQS